MIRTKGTKLHKALSLMMSPRLAKKQLDKVIRHIGFENMRLDLEYEVDLDVDDLDDAFAYGMTPQGPDFWERWDEKLYIVIARQRKLKSARDAGYRGKVYSL